MWVVFCNRSLFAAAGVTHCWPLDTINDTRVCLSSFSLVKRKHQNLLQSILGSGGNGKFKKKQISHRKHTKIWGWTFSWCVINIATTTNHLACAATMFCLFCLFFHLHEGHVQTIKWMKRLFKKKRKSDSNMVMMSWRHGVRLSWVLFVTAVAWNPSLLNTVTFDPFTLPSLPVDRRVLSSTVNPNVSFPSNDVVVNIRPLLIAQASSKGGRLDPTCAKKNKTCKDRKRLNRRVLCLFTVCLFTVVF